MESVNHPSPVRSQVQRLSVRHSLAAACLLVPALSGCERIKASVRAGPDLQWVNDSAFLENKPGVVFRLMPVNDTLAQVVPVASMGAQGARTIRMGDRGWRAFDLTYLQSDVPLHAVRRGRTSGGIASHRGFWEPSPRDTAKAPCQALFPTGYARISDRQLQLATSAPPTPLKHPNELSAGDLQEAIDIVPLLIAPTSGISTSQLQRYERRVFQVPSGSGPNPSIVLEFDDPEVPPDSVQPMGERPRHLIVVLDRGVYGYKPTWTYKSLGNRKDRPRLRFLDFLDVNGDGLVELFFGVRNPPEARGLVMLKFETDVWRETMEFPGQSCMR